MTKTSDRFTFLEPAFFAGLVDDPVLVAQVRPLGRSLLVDCGQIHHLAKRVLRSIDAVFITHAHMDHFMGMDTLARHVLVSPRTLEIHGPPGIAGRLTNKLASYDWNLSEDFWCSFRVREIHPGLTRTFLLPGPEGFPCRPEGEEARPDRTIYRNRYLTVEAETGDHKIPALFFRLTERSGFAVDQSRMEAAGLVPGPWIRALKDLFFRGRLAGTRLPVLRRLSGGIAAAEAPDAAALYMAIRAEESPGSIGYFTDLGFTDGNRERLGSLLRGVTLLVAECSYLAEDVARARASHHLCTADLNLLLDDLRPAFFLPLHLSKSYLGESERLFQQFDPPPGTMVLRLPEHLTPRPLLPCELPPAARGKAGASLR
jgi:ribonuclease Z